MSIKNIIKKIYMSSKYIRMFVLKFQGNTKKIKGKNNQLYILDAFYKKVSFEIYGDNNKIYFKKNANISNCKVMMRGNNHTLCIGENCTIKHGVLWFEDDSCSIVIGKETTIGDAHIAATESNSKIEIGNDCMFSSYIEIRNGDSHSILNLESMKRINYAKDVIIGDHVWIGAHVNVLKGVKIGSNSVVGIRSLVTRDVPNNCVVAGIPAKIIRSDITWTRERL